jgi:hypothetical protein
VIWARHPAAKLWCAVVAQHSSVVTACRGRFSIADDFAIDADPPAHVRCDYCERYRVDQQCIERGLDELVANTQFQDDGDAA